MITFMDTLTHDKHDPLVYGFCWNFHHDEETGDVIIEHNGLEYANKKDFESLLAFVRENES